ncbi:helix-turn-helix domain-containing protein [Lapidilactobacillus achengensis]|uniref:Helix-turn-helix domain-containing protein n=1 Tax=Lapidilactobacillus achengensis TaxID=2486000 RepID=A0ABW1UUR8_9LACO|nr:helix-turn-helix transcriptional regulator [Lapidilactobacillus achengensis]
MTANQFIAANIRSLRQRKQWSQEFVAERLNVSRQAFAKWESGASLPDINRCLALANLFGVDLNALVTYDEENTGVPIGPPGKHIFGVVTLDDQHQVTLPATACTTLGLTPGTQLMLLGDSNPGTAGLALVAVDQFLAQTGPAFHHLFPAGDDNV